jgi:carboxylate-amine ligase
MLQSQIEAVSPPCSSTQEARDHMSGFRRALAEEAAAQKLGIAAMGTFPLADWPDQVVTPSKRYDAILDDLQMIGLRNMLCGMHVHVEVPEPDTRVELMMRLTPICRSCWRSRPHRPSGRAI